MAHHRRRYLFEKVINENASLDQCLFSEVSWRDAISLNGHQCDQTLELKVAHFHQSGRKK